MAQQLIRPLANAQMEAEEELVTATLERRLEQVRQSRAVAGHRFTHLARPFTFIGCLHDHVRADDTCSMSQAL